MGANVGDGVRVDGSGVSVGGGGGGISVGAGSVGELGTGVSDASGAGDDVQALTSRSAINNQRAGRLIIFNIDYL
jgi:hypothetical protein